MTNPRILSGAALCGLASFLLVPACATDGADDTGVGMHQCESISKDAPDRDLRQAIDAMGLCGSSAVDVGDGYVVEDDIYLSKASLTDKQAHTTALVSTASVRTITVGVGSAIPVGGVDDWRGAVQAAVAVWNAVPFCMVHLDYTTSLPADINFTSDNGGLDDDTDLGLSEFPKNGNPGTPVLLNLDFRNDEQLNDAQKLRTAVHELGHCLGLRHTNWEAHEPAGEYGAIHISGTPDTDAASVMNTGEAGNEFAGLSAYDSLAIRTVYPELVTMIVEYTGCTSGTPRMAATWGGTLAQPTLEWQLDRYIGGTWSQVYRGPAQDWTFNVPTGTSLKTRVRGRSADGWSIYRIVTKTAPSCSTLPQ